MHAQLEDEQALQRHAQVHGDLRGVVVHGQDLRSADTLLRDHSAEGAVFIGCGLTEASHRAISASGGLIFPRLPHLPFRPYRPRLYAIDELMSGYQQGQPDSFARTTDGRIWAWYRSRRDACGQRLEMLDALSQRLHDHAMDDAVADLLGADPKAPGQARKVVAIMGGHALERGDAAYRQVVLLGQRLARSGYLVATGGGPGAMEAAHLGAWLRDADATAPDAAIEMLASAPCFRDAGWFETAYAVRDRWPAGADVDSLAVPTWFYGHEPSNLFARHVAKYFSNSLREDGLLAIASHGVVYAPGSAGTVQEVFMDAAQNHYGTFRLVSPMVFMGQRFWTEEMPVPKLLTTLAGDRQYAQLIGLVDDAAAAAAFIEEHPPVPYVALSHSGH